MSKLKEKRMEEVTSFKGIQVTGIGICQMGRIFVNSYFQ